MQSDANWCMSMQASQCNARGTTTRGRRQMRDNVKGADICLGRIQRQIIFQYYARLAWWYYMVLCRGLNVSLSFNIQSAVSCPPILWQAKVAITCSLPIDQTKQTKPNQVDGLTLLDQAGQAALQFCQPEDALSFIANATAGTFNQRGMCAHIYYSCLQSAALECKLSIILKV